MGSSRGWRAVALALGMVSCGVVASFAGPAGLWGTLALALLAGAWLASLLWWQVMRLPFARDTARPHTEDLSSDSEAVLQRLLLDAAPTPLVALQPNGARALNRAARRMFGTDARVLPLPPALADQSESHLRHEGRRWRIDRVKAEGETTSLTVAALVDVESEANLAEARASAELIDVLGHELLNGLSPIVSLAESARDAVQAESVDAALLGEILGPLARRAEGLQRFALAYRQLSSLPAPVIAACDIGEFLDDLQQSFVRSWPDTHLRIDKDDVPHWRFDRDQLYQALWALLNNAAEAAGQVPKPRVGLACLAGDKRLIFQVTDNGSGVDQLSTAHIFRPFHTTKPNGSGIGLSLARQIARAHGGTVELAAANPTRFTLALP